MFQFVQRKNVDVTNDIKAKPTTALKKKNALL